MSLFSEIHQIKYLTDSTNKDNLLPETKFRWKGDHLPRVLMTIALPHTLSWNQGLTLA